MGQMVPKMKDKVGEVGIAGNDQRLKRGEKLSCQYVRRMLSAGLWERTSDVRIGNCKYCSVGHV
jgi:hypothetical protein